MNKKAAAQTERAVAQYLARYSEPEAELVASLALEKNRLFHHCLVIPAYNESISALKFCLPALTVCPGSLAIFVINRPEHDRDAKPSEQFYYQLTHNKEKVFENSNIEIFYDTAFKIHLLVVDRFSRQTIATKQGVGLARKIGCDIALALRHYGYLSSRWIHTSDCDTRLPADYFKATNKLDSYSAKVSAAVYPFRHQALSEQSKAQLKATQLYEAALYYYVERLQYAGSPYAFHTIGSCLAVNADDYAKVRGFPKRAAGEDFYLLNKLAKLQPVHSLTEPTLIIDSRASARTPFGTGQAVSDIMSLAPEQAYRYYNSKSFTALKKVLEHIDQLPGYQGDFSQWLDQLAQPSQDALIGLGIGELFTHLDQHLKATHFVEHSHHWFDAFKTLKFIRFMQAYHPDEPIESKYYLNK